MINDKKNKTKSIIFSIFLTSFIIGVLILLIVFVHVFNVNYKKYEFKFINSAISIPLGMNSEVPIISVSDENVNVDDYIFTSSDNSIVTVNEDGKIIANGVGTAMIVVKAKKSNQKELLNVNVVLTDSVKTVQDINLNTSELNLKVGETYKVNYEIIPTGALVDYMLWSSSNTSVAIVDNGVIIGKGEGNCIISVEEGSIHKEIKVIVSKK